MSEHIQTIIENIARYDGTFPKEELQTLLDHPEDTTPFLLDAIRDPAEVLEKLIADEDYYLPIYALLMLAQFRETRAYPLIYSLFSADGEKIDEMLGDFVTSDLGRVLASVCGGDTSLIEKLIADENNYIYVRTTAVESWLSLLRAGIKTREEVVAYYRKLFQMPAGEDDLLRGSVVWCCLDMKADELMPELEKSYAEKKVDPGLMGDWQQFQQFFKESDESRNLRDRYELVNDLIGDLSQWYCFSDPEAFQGKEESVGSKPVSFFKSDGENFWDSDYDGTFVRETPKVGKNEPCPCGSGRKYKKCCLNKTV